ncbi:MAG: hypothetical protein F9K47_15355 [Burkholderiales bacterium]|nr:MAG: hypothetical protein F9K47_15355 [Burkholderiales bacterium]
MATQAIGGVSGCAIILPSWLGENGGKRFGYHARYFSASTRFSKLAGMSRFHLMHCVPHPRMHGLNGYKEVIESVAWGLGQLGHEVSYALNRYEPALTNIVFGAQVLPVEFLAKMPPNTVVYNFEQMRGLADDNVRPELRHCAKHFQIWEYSAANIERWAMLNAARVKLVPVGYAPILTRIAKPSVQDIDVLLYGMSGDKRAEAFHRLSQAGLVVVFASGLYGQARDALIARSKLVLNVNLYDHARIFEIVRVSYLLANRKAVVALVDPDTAMDEDLAASIRLSTMDRLVNDCYALADDPAERAQLARKWGRE